MDGVAEKKKEICNGIIGVKYYSTVCSCSSVCFSPGSEVVSGEWYLNEVHSRSQFIRYWIEREDI